MIEMYLFVEPTCLKCLASEKMAGKLAKELPHTIRLRFIPFMNIQVLNNNNQSKLDPYNLIVDYKAALFQGCKKGRAFITNLQQQLLVNDAAYTDALVYAIAKKVNLDLDMFKEDRQSKLINNTLQADQELTQEMKISNHGNLVLFDCSSSKNGLLIKQVNYAQLHHICQKIINKDSFNDFKHYRNLHVL